MTSTLLLLVSLSAAAASPSAPPAASVRFAASYEGAREQATKSSRPILVSFYTKWCGWCRKLDSDTFRDAAVAARSEKDVVFVKLDAEDGGTGSKLASQFKVRSFPTQVLVGADGTQIDQIRGYRPAAAFLADLDRLIVRHQRMVALLTREKSSPDDVAVLQEVANAYLKAGRDDLAVPRLERILERRDAKAKEVREPVLWEGAMGSMRLGEHDRSIRLLKTLLKEYPGSKRAEDALFALGGIQQMKGDLDGASETLTAFLGRYPQSRYAAGIETQLAAMRRARAGQ